MLAEPFRSLAVDRLDPFIAAQAKDGDQNAKDLDNILIDVLSVVEQELKPHAAPWS